MIFDFTFQNEKILKKDIMAWLTSKLLLNSWELISGDKLEVDGWVFHSKGISGQENLNIQIQDYYSSYTTRRLSNSNYGLIKARTFTQFNPSPNANSAGTVVPNSDYVQHYVFPNIVQPEEEIVVHYDINADRAILIFDTPDHATTTSTSFMGFGKLHTISKQSKESMCTVFFSHSSSNSFSSHGIRGYGAGTVMRTSQLHFIPVFRGEAYNERFASEIVIGNAVEGYRAYVENIFITNLFYEHGTRQANRNMRQDTYVDDLGNIYLFRPIGFLTSIAHGEMTGILFKVGVLDETD